MDAVISLSFYIRRIFIITIIFFIIEMYQFFHIFIFMTFLLIFFCFILFCFYRLNRTVKEYQFYYILCRQQYIYYTRSI